MRCEISTGHPDASFRPFPFAVRRLVSVQLYLYECLCVFVLVKVGEMGKRTSVCLFVCVYVNRCRLSENMLSFPFHGRLSWASPSCAALFCAMLDSARPGPAAQVLQNWSNYPVLCHPADELITASACFPLNLEASKHNVLLALAHTNSSGKHTFLSLLHTNRQSCTHSHTAAVTYPAANKPNLAHSRKITVFLQTH